MGGTMSRQFHSGRPRPAEYEEGRVRTRLTRRDFRLGGNRASVLWVRDRTHHRPQSVHGD
jgi:hypothetical protein